MWSTEELGRSTLGPAGESARVSSATGSWGDPNSWDKRLVSHFPAPGPEKTKWDKRLVSHFLAPGPESIVKGIVTDSLEIGGPNEVHEPL